MPEYISVTTPEIDGESGHNTSPTAYGQEIMLWSYNRDAICDRSSTEIDFYYPSSPRYDFCFCAGCARNAYEGVWEHVGVTGENWLTLQRTCNNCGGGGLLSGTWCEWCWTCQCSACLSAKGYDIRFTGEQGIFNAHFNQKRGCLPREWWHIFFVNEVQRPELGTLEDLEQDTELGILEDLEQGTESEEEADVHQGTENEEATDLEHDTENGGETDVELAPPAKCDWLAVAAVGFGVMAMWLTAVLV